MTQLSVKDELHRLIDEMSLKDAERVLQQIYDAIDSDELTPEEEAAVQEGRDQIAHGQYITGEEVRRKYGL